MNKLFKELNKSEIRNNLIKPPAEFLKKHGITFTEYIFIKWNTHKNILYNNVAKNSNSIKNREPNKKAGFNKNS